MPMKKIWNLRKHLCNKNAHDLEQACEQQPTKKQTKTMSLALDFEKFFKHFSIKRTGNAFKDIILASKAIAGTAVENAITSAFFDNYDADANGSINEEEFNQLLQDLNDAFGVEFSQGI